MYSIEKLAKLNDVLGGMVYPNKAPDGASISKINAHFGFQLPQDLIKFATHSYDFGGFFASLGNDYENVFHIIRINSVYKNMNRKKHGDKWRPAKPKEYIVINHGHDNDCYCFDLNDWNEELKEYRIVYWYPGIKETKVRFEGIYDFINSHVMNQVNYHLNNKNRSRSLRKYSRVIVDRINQII